MKINTISIKGIGGITELELSFNDRMNLICGPNGIGKTTVLECVAHLFTIHQSRILRRNVGSGKGECRASVTVNDQPTNVAIGVNDFDPEKESAMSGLRSYSKYLLSLKVTRTFDYQPLNAVGKDIDKNDIQISVEAKTGININEVKNWFVNRYLYSAHPGALTDNQISNLDLAKKCFSILQDGFSFSKVKASSNEIMVNTPSGEIYYEYLSSGFKSCLSIIFGIIKDIEFRIKDPEIKAIDFDGVVLIDELELHLHPEWQSKIATLLLEVFPHAQFIASTHSPHVIQNAQPNEIIALGLENGSVVQRSLIGSKYGFQGWTVEEVLTDVMGMSDTRTSTYHKTIDQFGQSISNENYELAKKEFEELDKMLHPDNHLRKLLKLQLVGIKGDGE